MARTATRPRVPAEEAAVVTKAVLRAADRLELSNKVLARILGLSEASISRMGSGTYVLAAGDKPFEVAILLLRLYRALDSLVGGDPVAVRAWLWNGHTVLGGVPGTMIQSLPGLMNVVGYLDARRTVV